MDLLRVLSSPDLEVRKKTLSLILDLINSRNVEEVGRGCVGVGVCGRVRVQMFMCAGRGGGGEGMGRLILSYTVHVLCLLHSFCQNTT